MNVSQLTEMRKKDALQKKEAYQKCKNDENHKLEEKK